LPGDELMSQKKGAGKKKKKKGPDTFLKKMYPAPFFGKKCIRPLFLREDNLTDSEVTKPSQFMSLVIQYRSAVEHQE